MRSLMTIPVYRDKSFCLKSETELVTCKKVNANMLRVEMLDCRKYPGAQYDRITLEHQKAMRACEIVQSML